MKNQLLAVEQMRLAGNFNAARAALTAMIADPEIDALGPRTSLNLPRKLHAAMLKLAKAEKNPIDRIGYQYHLVPPPAVLARFGHFTMAERRAINMANRAPVPQSIHQIWIGDRPVPVTTRAWAEYAARHGFDYRLWREADLGPLGIEDDAAFRDMLENRDYPGAVDALRYRILEKFGGIYLDCDWYPARPDVGFDEIWSMTGLTAMPEDIPRNIGPGSMLLANSVIASPPDHPVFTRLNAVLGDVMRAMPDAPAWWSTGPLIFSVVARSTSLTLAGSDLVAGSVPDTASLAEVKQFCRRIQQDDGGLLLAWKPWG